MKRLQLTSAGSVAAGLAALVVSSCCALPMALVFMGVSTGAVGLLGPLHAFRPIILVAAGGLLAAAWTMAIRQRSSRAYPVIVLGTAVFALSFYWQTWDPILQRLVMRIPHS